MLLSSLAFNRCDTPWIRNSSQDLGI